MDAGKKECEGFPRELSRGISIGRLLLWSGDGVLAMQQSKFDMLDLRVVDIDAMPGLLSDYQSLAVQVVDELHDSLQEPGGSHLRSQAL